MSISPSVCPISSNLLYSLTKPQPSQCHNSFPSQDNQLIHIAIFSVYVFSTCCPLTLHFAQETFSMCYFETMLWTFGGQTDSFGYGDLLETHQCYSPHVPFLSSYALSDGLPAAPPAPPSVLLICECLPRCAACDCGLRALGLASAGLV